MKQVQQDFFVALYSSAAYSEAARVVEEAIKLSITENIKTFDLGGGATTNDVGMAIAEGVRKI